DNIERAIAKGTGEGVDADQLETVLYEGYGPGGVALLIEAVTDNRNRTGADVRHALSKHGGNLGEPGSVSYLFDKRGVIVVDAAVLERIATWHPPVFGTVGWSARPSSLLRRSRYPPATYAKDDNHHRRRARSRGRPGRLWQQHQHRPRRAAGAVRRCHRR